MKPRNPLPSSSQHAFGLVAWLEQTRLVLPLKGVECRFHITGAVACVELDQIYHQASAKALDCTYTFPLPAGAAVHRCEVHINGRVIRGRVEERNAARDLHRTHKAAGRRTTLVETERENLFTLTLGNVQPGDLVIVRFAWFQVLDRAAGHLRLLVPTCPGVRYIPGKPLFRAQSGRGSADDTDQVPDASRITPPRMDALHPDAAYFAVTGRLALSEVEPGTLSSPSHSVLVRQEEQALAVELGDQSTVPDRDFVLAWREPASLRLAPRGWRWNDGRHTYALVQLRAPHDMEVDSRLSQDFYFLLDRSGSMAGEKWEKSCDALHGFVKLLGREDRVWITVFESEFMDFGSAPMRAPAVLADEGFRHMRALGTAGGTELLPAARHVLGKIAAHSGERRASVILITDGQVGNESEVLLEFAKAPHVSVHTFGIDTAVNDAFLKSLARQHRGGCWLQTPDDDIAGTVSALGDRLRRPVLERITVGGTWESATGSVPDLHARDVVAVTIRGTAGESVEVTGLTPGGTTRTVIIPLGAAGSEAVKLLWARERITALLAAGLTHEAITLAKAHNILCEGAAFIAWDEQEQVAIAEEDIAQPVMSLWRRIIGASSGVSAAAPPTVLYSPRRFALSPRPPGSDSAALGMKRENSAGLPDWSQFLDAGEPHSPGAEKDAARRIEKAMREAGVPGANARALRKWADEADALSRCERLVRALDAIAACRRQFGDLLKEERRLAEALAGTVEGMEQWLRYFAIVRSHLEQLVEWQPTIGEAFMRKIIRWLTQHGTFDVHRLETILAKLNATRTTGFSASSKQRQRQMLADLEDSLASSQA